MEARTSMYVGTGFIKKLNDAVEQGGKECPVCFARSVEIVGFNFIVEGDSPTIQKKCVKFDLSCRECGKRFCGPLMYSQVGRTISSDGMSHEQRQEADALLEKDLLEV